jgi:hypothetical protein
MHTPSWQPKSITKGLTCWGVGHHGWASLILDRWQLGLVGVLISKEEEEEEEEEEKEEEKEEEGVTRMRKQLRCT